MITSRLSRLAAAVALFAGLAACNRAPREATDVVSDVDLARAAVLSSDPVLATAQGAPTVSPGRFRSAQLGWDRTQVGAQLYLQRTGPDGIDPTPAEVERQLTAVIGRLRAGGWNVHWAVCIPNVVTTPPDATPSPAAPSPATPSPAPDGAPAASPSPSPPAEATTALANIPVEVPQYDGWEWVVFVNKIIGGVSYWGMLVATIIEDSGAFINLVMRAPNARDGANLFPVAPPMLPAGSTCAEDGKASTGVQAAGVPVLIKDWLPFPGQSHSPDPHRL